MVRCAKCGYLAVRNPETRSLEEVNEEAREKGIFPSVYTGSMNLGLSPRCFRMATDIGAECKAVKEVDGKKETDSKRIYLAVITKDRDCPKFSEWQPGYSPKEHQEMEQARELKAWQEKQKENDRQWQEQQRRNDRYWNAGQAIFVEIISAIISWTVSAFATRDKGRTPIHVHIDNQKDVNK